MGKLLLSAAMPLTFLMVASCAPKHNAGSNELNREEVAEVDNGIVLFNNPSAREIVEKISETVEAGKDVEKVEIGFKRFAEKKVVRGKFKVVLDPNDPNYPGEFTDRIYDGNECLIYFTSDNWRDGSPSYIVMVKSKEVKKYISMHYPFKPGFEIKKDRDRSRRIISWHLTGLAADGYSSLDLDSQNRFVGATQAYKNGIRNVGEIFADRLTDLTHCVLDKPLKIKLD